MSQELVVHYQYHYSTDYAWYLVLRAYLGHSIGILTHIDKVSLLSPGNNKHFGIRLLINPTFGTEDSFFSKIMPTYLKTYL